MHEKFVSAAAVMDWF